MQSVFRNSLCANHLTPVWNLALEHGRLVGNLPPELPDRFSGFLKTMRASENAVPFPRLIFELPPIDRLLMEGSKSLASVISLLKLEETSLRGSRLWVVYQNDGALPFNPGSGSDQWQTASLALFFTFDEKRTGLTKLGWTVIDMRTPKGTLAAGEAFSSQSRYAAAAGPFSGISSLDFTVTVVRTGGLKVDVTGSVGVDSSQWGKFVQDFIHEKVSNSPLFPWPKETEKFYAQGGAALMLTPGLVLNKDEVYGIAYQGTIELGASAEAGTHRTEATAQARYVIRTAKVRTKLGEFQLEFSPLGAFGRAFLRYNDGREAGFSGVEGGVTSAAMVNIGRLGIGVTGQIMVSTDPAAQTGNPAGSRPLLSPLKEIPGQERLGGPAGHHGSGGVVLTWRF